MTTKGILSLTPVQLAYHVPDPIAAAEYYAKEYGWGPFFLLEHIPLASCRYRDQPGTLDHSSAYGQAGDMMVELISQTGDEPSALRDMYAAHESGLHHVACFVPNLAAALKEYRGRDMAVALEARTTTGVEFAMVDAVATLGHMLELYESSPSLTNFYSYVRKHAQGWDGANPVRRL